MLSVKWKNNPPNQWWEAAEFTLTNNTSADLVDPLIEFTVDTGQKVEENSGLTIARPEGSNHVKGRLKDWLKTVKAGTSATFSVGVSPVSGSDVGLLPRNLKVNGQGGDDPNKPTTPGNFAVTSTSDTEIRLRWDASSSPAGIKHYELLWAPDDGGAPGHAVIVGATTYTVTGLEPETSYRLSLTALDNNDQSSEPATTNAATDVTPVPPPAGYPTSAPFVDACFWPTPRLRKWFKQWGVKGFFLGFWAPVKINGRWRLTWGGYDEMTDKYEPQPDTACTAGKQDKVTAVAADTPYLTWLTRDIQKRGGVIIPSVGGSASHPIEQEPDVTVDEAVAEYLAALDNYGTEFLDFDIEGQGLTTLEQQRKHVQVLLKLRERRPALRISHTFSIDIDGYNHHTLSLVDQMAIAGYKPDMVQGMLMEMRVINGDYFQSLKAGAEWMVKHHCEKFGWSEAESWSRLGLCPMFGANNGAATNPKMVTTVNHMRQLVTLATDKGVATVSGWSANRDYNANNPDQKCEQTQNCTVGPPFNNIYACTHVEQQHAEFSKIAATYTGKRGSEPRPPGAIPPGEPGSGGGMSGPIPPVLPVPDCGCNVTVNVEVNVDCG